MIKKNRVISDIIFGILLTLFLIFQFRQTHQHLTTKDIIAVVIIAIFSICIGTLVGRWVMKLIMKSPWITQSAKLDTLADEIILFQTPANHFKGIERVGGHLFLTNKRLVFQSYKLTFQNHKLSINLSDITKIDKYKRLGLKMV